MDANNQQNSSIKRGPVAVFTTLGLIAAVLGFVAEATKLQLAEVNADVYGNGCIYPSHSGLVTNAVIALVALFTFRLYCPGIRGPASSMVQLSRHLSWISWFVALTFYVVGLTMTKNQGNKIEYRYHSENYYSCNVVKPGIFGAGASFALTSVVLEIVYLVATHNRTDQKTITSEPSTQPSVVAMC